MNISGLHGLTSAILQVATFLLVGFALASIAVFFKIYKSDFRQDD